MSRNALANAVLGLAVALGATAVAGHFAPATAVPAVVRKMCAGDYKRLCPKYKVGSAALRGVVEGARNVVVRDTVGEEVINQTIECRAGAANGSCT